MVSHLIGWFRTAARDLPWRRTRDPYAIWVSEIMLQQTQVATVIPYYERWMRTLPNVRKLARASSPQLHKLWEGLGYYRRVRHMQAAAKQIVREHGGQFPCEFDQVLALPGVGRYTAGAICSIAFNQPTPIVDGNVLRVLTRLFGITGDPREATVNARLWRLAEALVKEAALSQSEIRNSDSERNPKSEARTGTSRASSRQLRASFGIRTSGIGIQQPGIAIPPPQFSDAAPACSHLNQSLMELGATVCTPRAPRCESCPLAGLCVARRRGVVEMLPRLKPRPRVIEHHRHAFVLERHGRFLAGRNAREKVNGQLWEFPTVEVRSGSISPRVSSRKALGSNTIAWQPKGEVRHSITRYRIRMQVFRGHSNDSVAPGLAGRRWLNRAALRRLPFAAAHRRVADALLTERETKRPLARPRLRA